MSTTQTQRTLPKAHEKQMPTLCCLGYVAEVGDVKLTQSGSYISCAFKLNGIKGSRSTYTNVYLRPEWLEPGFVPDSELAGDFMFRKAMGTSTTPGALDGILGDGIGQFLSNLESRGPVTAETLRQTFVEHFSGDNAGATIGYVLKQRSDKTDEVNEETGKNIYVLTNQYEVSEWFSPTPENIEKKVKRASKPQRAGAPSFLIAFEGY